MSDGTATTDVPQSWLDDPATRFRLRFAGTVLILLLSVIGIGFVGVRSTHALAYWMALSAASGLVCMGLAAVSQRGRPGASARILRQALHWSGLAIALWLVFAFYARGFLDADHTATFAVVLLTLTTWLAGVHFDWVFGVLAVLLAGIAWAGAVVAQSFVWLALAGVVVVAGLLAWRRRAAGS